MLLIGAAILLMLDSTTLALSVDPSFLQRPDLGKMMA